MWVSFCLIQEQDNKQVGYNAITTLITSFVRDVKLPTLVFNEEATEAQADACCPKGPTPTTKIVYEFPNLWNLC